MAVLLLGTMGLVGFAALSWIITLAGLSAVHDTFAEYVSMLARILTPASV